MITYPIPRGPFPQNQSVSYTHPQSPSLHPLDLSLLASLRKYCLTWHTPKGMVGYATAINQVYLVWLYRSFSSITTLHTASYNAADAGRVYCTLQHLSLPINEQNANLSVMLSHTSLLCKWHINAAVTGAWGLLADKCNKSNTSSEGCLTSSCKQESLFFSL